MAALSRISTIGDVPLSARTYPWPTTAFRLWNGTSQDINYTRIVIQHKMPHSSALTTLHDHFW
jgi:hypothetical protein